jgi:uncharacterized protein YjiS (DUF1127 family)
MKMSVFTDELMTGNHGFDLFSRLADTFHLWRERYAMRRELAAWSDRDLHDIGLSSADVAYEVDKPFWRA